MLKWRATSKNRRPFPKTKIGVGYHSPLLFSLVLRHRPLDGTLTYLSTLGASGTNWLSGCWPFPWLVDVAFRIGIKSKFFPGIWGVFWFITVLAITTDNDAAKLTFIFEIII